MLANLCAARPRSDVAGRWHGPHTFAAKATPFPVSILIAPAVYGFLTATKGQPFSKKEVLITSQVSIPSHFLHIDIPTDHVLNFWRICG